VASIPKVADAAILNDKTAIIKLDRGFSACYLETQLIGYQFFLPIACIQTSPYVSHLCSRYVTSSIARVKLNKAGSHRGPRPVEYLNRSFDFWSPGQDNVYLTTLTDKLTLVLRLRYLSIANNVVRLFLRVLICRTFTNDLQRP
jgi:hypothetical protein